MMNDIIWPVMGWPEILLLIAFTASVFSFFYLIKKYFDEY